MTLKWGQNRIKQAKKAREYQKLIYTRDMASGLEEERTRLNRSL